MIETNSVCLILQKARVRLCNPAFMALGTRARNLDGDPVDPTSPDAISWCIESAVCLAAEEEGVVAAPLLELLDKAAIELFPEQLRIKHVSLDTHEPEEPVCAFVTFESVSYVNDFLGYDAVLQVIDRAIAWSFTA